MTKKELRNKISKLFEEVEWDNKEPKTIDQKLDRIIALLEKKDDCEKDTITIPYMPGMVCTAGTTQGIDYIYNQGAGPTICGCCGK